MLDLLQTYLQIGVQPGAEPTSFWPLAIAAMLIAVAILQRRSDE